MIYKTVVLAGSLYSAVVGAPHVPIASCNTAVRMQSEKYTYLSGCLGQITALQYMCAYNSDSLGGSVGFIAAMNQPLILTLLGGFLLALSHCFPWVATPLSGHQGFDPRVLVVAPNPQPALVL